MNMPRVTIVPVGFPSYWRSADYNVTHFSQPFMIPNAIYVLIRRKY